MRTPAPAGPQPSELIVVAVECAPPAAGVKVVRPRLRLRALHLDPAASTGAPRHQDEPAHNIGAYGAAHDHPRPSVLDNRHSFRDAVRRATMLLMPELNARPVDPRDTRWEVWSPAYRVFLWSRSNEAWASREFEIGAADVDDVLDWIREQSDAEMFTLYATVDRGDDLGLVRLAGHGPHGAHN